jgi:hypothetical protein
VLVHGVGATVAGVRATGLSCYGSNSTELYSKVMVVLIYALKTKCVIKNNYLFYFE